MIFGQDRNELRKMYADAWAKRCEGLPLSPLETQIADVVESYGAVKVTKYGNPLAHSILAFLRSFCCSPYANISFNVGDMRMMRSTS